MADAPEIERRPGYSRSVSDSPLPRVIELPLHDDDTMVSSRGADAAMLLDVETDDGVWVGVIALRVGDAGYFVTLDAAEARDYGSRLLEMANLLGGAPLNG